MKGKIIIISGPSGAGKGTIADALRQDKELNLSWAKSYTTRPKRESDKIENHYIFVKSEEFKKLQTDGDIIEANLYNGNWYGSSRKEIDKLISAGKNVIKDVDVNGGLFYKKYFPDAVLVFVTTNLSNLRKRLVLRGQNTPKEIEERIKTAQEEMKIKERYHFIVENPEGHPEIAIEKIKQRLLNWDKHDKSRNN